MSGVFSDQILADKLSKLNASQTSIETLSHWCIFHRKRAPQIVMRWEKDVRAATEMKKTAFLYLANDIIQNSRRKGTEFIIEFGKVLPSVCKDFCSVETKSKSVVLRLINIWEERKVFGDQEKPLQTLLLFESSPIRIGAPQARDVENNVKVLAPSSQQIQSHLIGPLEKIATAYSLVQDSSLEEDTLLRKCDAAVMDLASFQKSTLSQIAAGPSSSEAMAALQSKAGSLSSLGNQLEVCERKRAALVNLLRDAFQIQESKLERVRSHIQAARSVAEQAIAQMAASAGTAPSLPAGPKLSGMAEATGGSVLSPTQPPMPSFPPASAMAPGPTGSDAAQKKQEAADLAVQLASSSSSAAMLTAVLSSLAAEGKLPPGLADFSLPGDPRNAEKRRRLEEPVQSYDPASLTTAQLTAAPLLSSAASSVSSFQISSGNPVLAAQGLSEVAGVHQEDPSSTLSTVLEDLPPTEQQHFVPNPFLI